MAQIFKRKNGYSIRFYIKDEFGKNERVYLTGFKTKGDALKAAEKIIEENNLIAVNKGNLTVEEYMNEWLYRHKDNIKRKTLRDYADMISLHIVPNIGHIRINKLKQSHLMDLYERLKNKLSNKSISNVHRCLHVAFEYATRWDYLSSNPVSKVSPPRVNKVETIIIKDRDLGLILNSLRYHESFIVFYMLASTGARAGEIAALKYSDIDLKNKTITIKDTLSRYKEDKGPKTKDSMRTILLLNGTENELIKYLKNKKIHNEYAFTWNNGKPFQVSFLSKKFKSAVRKLNLDERYKLHSLRHTHASNLLKTGIPLKVVSERLGHANINTTADIYGHITIDMQKEVLKNTEFNLYILESDK